MVLPSNSLSIESIQLSSLRPASRNARRHSRKQTLKIQKSLNHFGHVRPILVSPDLEIIDGHLICEALKANGATTVRAIVVHGLSPIEIRALRLMLHRSAEDAVWDTDALRIELQAILDAGLDLDLSGFDTPDFDRIFGSDIPQANVSENGSDIPQAETKPISKSGDICNAANIASAAATRATRSSLSAYAADASQIFPLLILLTTFRSRVSCQARDAITIVSSLRAAARCPQTISSRYCEMPYRSSNRRRRRMRWFSRLWTGGTF